MVRNSGHISHVMANGLPECSLCGDVGKDNLKTVRAWLSVAEMLRRHKPLLLNWFRARGEFSAGCVEGMNGKAKLTMKKAYGFKSFNVAEVALLHTLGKLPTPEVTHTFW